jgi:c-di-GMP-binding flagellar brake protein YcgR
MVTLDIGGPTITLKTSIENIASNRKLELINIESVSHEQKREYFRIDAQVPVDAHTLPSQGTFVFEGETVNISGSGALITFPEPVPVDKKLKLRISIPEPDLLTVECIAQVVRCDEGNNNEFNVAVHFYTIEEEAQDKIIAFCMAQQRRQLRLKVQVLGPA